MSLPAHPPVELAKYELLEEIGHGGMATVYRGRDRRLHREVAVKIIHRHLRGSAEVGARFQSEALAVAKVKHPNIVEVYDVSSEEDEEKYLVVELIRGITLRQLLLEQGPLPPEIAACIAVEVCRATAVAHREGVVHRDIKPENVLLRMEQGPDSGSRGSEDARVKLTDFGIAKLLDAQGVTHTGQVLGSPAHMAPEQIEGGDVDARSDVFSTGVLLYEMLTGTLPFEGKNPAQVLRKVLEGVFLPAERLLPKVGGGYGGVAGKALAHDPNERFASANEMGEALESELRSLGLVNVRAEIAEYLEAPSEYKQRHDAEFPDVIAEQAAAARENREVIRAAALFNRALAYRPDNTQLLAEVAGLARRGRFRRRIVSIVFVSAAVVAAAAAVIYGWNQWENSSPSAKDADRGSAKTASAAQVPVARGKLPVTPQTDVAGAAPAQLGDSPKSKPSTVKVPRVQTPATDGKRTVRTPVVGPQNARVSIDGNVVPWFQRHELSWGPHTFEFVPPNNECCETSPPQVVQIVDGDGDQVVRGVIKFRPATIRLQGPVGSRASCGMGGVILAGEGKSIQMNRPSLRLTCTVFPPLNGQGEPKEIDVDLRPGRTFTLTST